MSGLLGKVAGQLVGQLSGQNQGGHQQQQQQSGSSDLLHKITDAVSGQSHNQHGQGQQGAGYGGNYPNQGGYPPQQHMMGQGQGYPNPPYNQGFGHRPILHNVPCFQSELFSSVN